MNSNNPPQSLAPFSCKYSPQIPELLMHLGCTIAISTYQAGKVVFISPKDENSLIQLPRTFEKPMGIAQSFETDKLALACKDEVIVFRNSENLAKHYPKFPQRYDSLYMPRVIYNTGGLDIHDLSFGEGEQLYAVNTLFSCLVKIDDNYNFTPYWRPSFIDKIVSEDRCHLNGMALQRGKPKYATAFNNGNTYQSWREKVTKTGILIDVDSNEIIAKELAMPHSPRVFNNQLYVLLSATGELVKIDVASGKKETVIQLQGFVRGMDIHKDYLFIGLSKLRENSSTFAKLDFAKNANEAGIAIVHLPTGALVGKISYLTSVDEIYDVHIMPGKLRPNILNPRAPESKQGLSTPDSSYWAKREE